MLARTMIGARVRAPGAQITSLPLCQRAGRLARLPRPQAAADAAGDALNKISAKGAEVAQQAKDGLSSAAAAAKEAAQQLADKATSAVDAFSSEMAASASDLKSKARGSKEAALDAFDAFAEVAVRRMQKLGGIIIPGDAEAKAKVDAIGSSFTLTADSLRQEVIAGTKSAGQAIDQLAGVVASSTKEIRALVVDVAKAAAAKAGVDISVPAAPGDFKGLAATVGDYLQLWTGLGSLYYLDQVVKSLLLQASIKFPSALAGMFGVFFLLCLVGDKTADKVLGFYAPALDWIARWLPLFYVPALVTLPLALQGIPGVDLARILGILSVGMVATLLFTAQITVAIREAVKTPVIPVPKGKASPPFQTSHFIAWGAIAATSLAATLIGDAATGLQMVLPFGLAATVGGFLIGNLVPAQYQGVLHPVVVTAFISNAGVAFHGALRGLAYDASQKVYLAKGAGPTGAGDLLMSLLGLVIVSFGFRVYTQRNTMKRHFPEIIGATILSSVFSLFSTAFAAKAIGLSSSLARALVPRSVTVALALPISQGLEAPLAITAAAVLLQGILGANFGPGLMTRAGIKDTIARGLAAAGTAGGLGTASLVSKEPEALPFCALSYALVGIFSTVLMSVPAVQGAIISIVG